MYIIAAAYALVRFFDRLWKNAKGAAHVLLHFSIRLLALSWWAWVCGASVKCISVGRNRELFFTAWPILCIYYSNELFTTARTRGGGYFTQQQQQFKHEFKFLIKITFHYYLLITVYLNCKTGQQMRYNHLPAQRTHFVNSKEHCFTILYYTCNQCEN